MFRSISASNPLFRGLLLALGRLIPLVGLCILAAVPATAQGPRMNTNTATAVLHLQAFIVPVAQLPVAQQPLADTQLVNYSIPKRSLPMDVHVETTNMPSPIQNQPETPAVTAELRTTVVVVP